VVVMVQTVDAVVLVLSWIFVTSLHPGSHISPRVELRRVSRILDNIFVSLELQNRDN
jgi:hypothetical protein